MISRSALALGLLLLVNLLIWSCGDGGSEPANTGRLELVPTTSGSDPDMNGYTASIDGSSPITLTPFQIQVLNVSPGDHSVLVGDVAQNCELAGANPRTVTITAGSTTSVPLDVTCRPTLTGRWIVTAGFTPGGAGPCIIPDLTLNIIEKHNPTQPVDSLLGTYSGGEGSCPYDSFDSGIVYYPLAYPLDNRLFGVIDRVDPGDTVTFSAHFGADPNRGTLGGFRDSDSLVITLFSFVQNPTGSVVRSIAVGRRQ